MALSEEDKAELAEALKEARRILREDAVLAHNKKMDERWQRVHGPDPDAGGGGDPGNPDQPPAPDPKDPPVDKPKKGIWWGDALNQE